MAAGFLEIQLDPLVSYGTQGGNKYPVTLVTNPARRDTRIPQSSRGYWEGTITFADKTKAQMKAIRAHWDAVGGKLYGWRYRNWHEYYTCTDNGISGVPSPEPITSALGAGGTTLQLTHTRNYAGQIQTVLVKKPDLVKPIILYRDGNLTTPYAASNYTLDKTTGIITFTSNQTGHTFHWRGEWDTPVRFDLDAMVTNWVGFDEVHWEGVNITEIVIP